MAKIGMFFVINFLSIIPFEFTLRRDFCEEPLLKTTLHHVYTVKPSCDKIPSKNCLKKKHRPLLGFLLKVNFDRNYD